MKNKSVFKSLPPEDQTHILNLCANHTYDEVLEILARPRPEGLQLKTSYSALCRFNCAHNAEVRKATVLNQAAASLQYVRQRGSGSFRTAILAMIESRIFEALRAGQSIVDLKDDLAALKDVQKGFLAEEKWRHDPDIDPKAELTLHQTGQSIDAHYDFVPCDEHGEPTDIPPLSQDEINRLNETDEVTPEDIARLDERIYIEGRGSAQKWARHVGYPSQIVQQRLKAYDEDLHRRGLTPLAASVEVRRARLRINNGAGSLPSTAPDKST